MPFAPQLYRWLMLTFAALLLGLYLVCVTSGVLTLCVYEDLSGLGVMAVGGVLYFGAKLALFESRASFTDF